MSYTRPMNRGWTRSSHMVIVAFGGPQRRSIFRITAMSTGAMPSRYAFHCPLEVHDIEKRLDRSVVREAVGEP